MNRDQMSTYETDQPWVVYHYGRTHDGWWPFWRSTRVLGYGCIVAERCVCGRREPLWIRIPRFRSPARPDKHPKRVAFLERHAHPDRGHPLGWARPLRNLAAWPPS